MSTPTVDRPGYPAARPPFEAPLPAPVPPESPDPAEPAGQLDIRVPMPALAALAALCSAWCLGGLFDGWRWWLLPSAGAIVLAAVTGELGRRVHTPRLAMPLLYVAAGWLYVMVVAVKPAAAPGSASSPRISLIPSPATWSALRALAEAGSRDIRSLTVPVPERPGFLFLTVAGVYLIAALVDAVAVGLHRPAAAGLPLLALVAVPAAVIERGVGLLPLLAAFAAYLAMLLTSGQASMIGWAGLPPGAASGVRRMTGSTGRRIGAVALVAALAVPVVIPRYTGVARQHRGGGGGSTTVIEPVVTLAGQLRSDVVQPLLTVRTDTPEYLRLTALEHFDSQRFTLGALSAKPAAKVSRGLPAAIAGTHRRVEATVSVLPVLHQRYLPVPYRPTTVNVAGDWRLASRNFTIFSAKNDTSGLRYAVTSEVATPTQQQLESQSAGASVPADVAASTALPGGLPKEVGALSRRLTSPYDTEYGKAAAIQDYLRGPDFTYDLTGAPTGSDALADFLLRSKRGYCEQFAGAMVVLARQAGIPARVAVGFTPGTRQPDGSWLITNHDAHSWPEIWFPQAGWVRFEPTKRDESTTPPDYATAPATGQPSPTPAPVASTAPSAPVTSAPATPAGRDFEPATAGFGDSHGSSTGHPGWWAAGSVVLLGLLLTPATVRRRRRRLRLSGANGTAADVTTANVTTAYGGGTRGSRAGFTQGQHWREIVDTATDLGLDVPATLAPRRAVEHWASQGEAEGLMPDAVHSVLIEAARAEELVRYGGQPREQSPATRALRTALRDWERSGGGWTRARSVLAPRSLRRAAAEPAGRPFARLWKTVRRFTKTQAGSSR